jgi:type IV fimbrial biogenesis protein FimT
MAIVLAIVAVLFKMVVPSFRAWIQNSQIRNAAQSIANGMSIARGEAVRRNVDVQFQVTTGGSGASPSWQVALVSSPNASLQAWSSGEGAGNVQIVQSGGGLVTFNSAGRVQSPNPTDSSASLLTVDVTTSLAATDAAIRPLRVQVGAAGMARVCDPQLAKPDPRAC